MRIGFVTLQYPPHDAGGIGSYVQIVAATMARAGHDVTVICPARGQRRSTAVEDGVVVERFGVLGPRGLWQRWVRPSQTQRVRLHHALSTRWALWRTRRSFDVIEVPEWKAQPLLLSGAVVVHLHLTLEIQHAWIGVAASRRLRLSYRLERAGAARARARTATSRQTTRLPNGSRWLPDEQVQIVSPPIDVSQWSEADDVGDTAPTVLFVGRLERRKAPELLIEAVALLRAEGIPARVVFVGKPMLWGGRPYDDALRSLAASAGVPIELRPPVSDVSEMRAIYGQARVVAVPSRFETLSMVAFEALASGRPVVMTDQVGAAEWVGEDLPGSVVPADDPEALAGALRPHLSDVAHARDAGRRGRQLVADVCAPAQLVDSRLAVYRAAMEGGCRVG